MTHIHSVPDKQVHALHPCQQFFSHVPMFIGVETVLSSEYKESCSSDSNLRPLGHKTDTRPMVDLLCFF